MSEQQSPATEGNRPSWSSTPTTYTGRRPTTQGQRAPRSSTGFFATIPDDGDQCDRLLDTAAARARQRALGAADYNDLARFLGAASRVWTPARRARLRDILASGGAVTGTTATLRAVADLPRAEVLDDAFEVLRAIAERDDEIVTLAIHTLMPALAATLGRPSPIVAESDAIRAILVRLLGSSNLTKSVYGLAPLSFALEDASPHVRDAAIQALGATGGRLARGILERHRRSEIEAFLRDQIDVALEEMPAR